MEMYEVKDRNLWRKFKALLTSRSDTLKQSDMVTDMLMTKLQLACANEQRATTAASKFAQLVIQQNEALVVAREALDAQPRGDRRTPLMREALDKVNAAIEASAAHL